MRVRGLKLLYLQPQKEYRLSHPVRVRGLKQTDEFGILMCIYVAPRAGAWIETEPFSCSILATESHPMRVRGLKQFPHLGRYKQRGSHPMRVRGLKRLSGGL